MGCRMVSEGVLGGKERIADSVNPLSRLGFVTEAERNEQFTDGLTAAQRAAVLHSTGPALVLAGPGSGKTRVITRRIAALIGSGVAPQSILALTFTNKAAKEMRDRVAALLAVDPRRLGLTVSTFHAFCAKLLRRYGPSSPAAGLGTALAANFTICDADDARQAVSEAIETAELNKRNWSAGMVAGMISNAKNALLTAAEFRAQAGDFQAKIVARVYEVYEQQMRRCDLLDFDDLLLRSARMLREDAAVREALQRQFQFTLIDEYQDTNLAQFVVASHIAAANRNIMVVGDPDQSIYGWRGADIRNILQFEDKFGAAAVIELGENFRSTEHIVAAAAGLIAHNQRRKRKSFSTSLGEGNRPQLIRLGDGREEANAIVAEVERASRDGMPWSSMAVLYRMNALSRVLEDAFRHRAIPYVIARGTAFYERREVKDALSYLRSLANPRDEVSLKRMIRSIPRGIGDESLGKVEALAAARGCSLLEAMGAGDALAVKPRSRKSIDALLLQFARWSARLDGGVASELGEFVRDCLAESGLVRHTVENAADPQDALDRQSNIDELANAAAEQAEGLAGSLRQALGEYLESVTLVADADLVDPEAGAVTLMTLHAAKGLEFDLVAIAAVEEGILPHSRSLSHPDELEEERRLLFVGMTRARRRLLVTWAASRGFRGEHLPSIESSFIREIPGEHIQREDRAAVWMGGASRGPMSSVAPTSQREMPRVRESAPRGHAPQWRSGLTVRHPLFGLGRIEEVIPRGAVTSVRVKFQRGPERTLVTEYAKLEVVDRPG